MEGFLDFLKGMGGAGQAVAQAAPGAASGPGSVADPFKALPTLSRGGFLQGIDPHKLGQAFGGMQDGQDPAPAGGAPAMQQLMQMQGQRQALIQQLLGGR